MMLAVTIFAYFTTPIETVRNGTVRILTKHHSLLVENHIPQFAMESDSKTDALELYDTDALQFNCRVDSTIYKSYQLKKGNKVCFFGRGCLHVTGMTRTSMKSHDMKLIDLTTIALECNNH